MEDVEARLNESICADESATTQKRPPHHPTRKTHNDTNTALENDKNNMGCATSNSDASEERRSARHASQRDRLVGGLHPAVDTGPRGGKDLGKGKQSVKNARAGSTVEHRAREGCVSPEGDKVCKDQTSNQDESSHDGIASDQSGPPTAYPKSLMIQQPPWAHGQDDRGTKRVNGDDEPQHLQAKRHHNASTENTTCLTLTSPFFQSSVNPVPKTQQPTEDVDVLKTRFRSRWADKLPTFDAWQKMDRFARIGARPDQEPYVELEVIMQRVLSIGTLKVQASFAQTVTAWIASPHLTKCAPEPPDHLGSIPGFEAGPFQRFWKAMEVSRCAKGVEDIATILGRKSLVDLMSAYNEVTKHVRLCAGSGKLKLRSGETAGAKAREIVYSILYPEAETRKKMRSFFSYDQQCANAYVKLEKRFGNIGILAMIPTKLNEMDFRSTDARFAALMELLDMVRPELRGTRVKFYAGIIETIAGGGVPNASTLQELSVWTSTKSSLRSPTSIEQALSTPIDAESQFT